jgi:hypothetical protein
MKMDLIQSTVRLHNYERSFSTVKDIDFRNACYSWQLPPMLPVGISHCPSLITGLCLINSMIQGLVFSLTRFEGNGHYADNANERPWEFDLAGRDNLGLMPGGRDHQEERIVIARVESCAVRPR